MNPMGFERIVALNQVEMELERSRRERFAGMHGDDSAGLLRRVANRAVEFAGKLGIGRSAELGRGYEGQAS